MTGTSSGRVEVGPRQKGREVGGVSRLCPVSLPVGRWKDTIEVFWFLKEEPFLVYGGPIR